MVHKTAATLYASGDRTCLTLESVAAPATLAVARLARSGGRPDVRIYGRPERLLREPEHLLARDRGPGIGGDVVDEPAEVAVTEFRVVPRVEDEVVPDLVEHLRRGAGIPHQRTDHEELPGLLEVALRVLERKPLLAREAGDKRRVLVAHGSRNVHVPIHRADLSLWRIFELVTHLGTIERYALINASAFTP